MLNQHEKEDAQASSESDTDSITYRPTEPSNFRTTPESSDNENDDSLQPKLDGYNLRQRQHIDYTALAIPETITTIDEPSIKSALNSSERNLWIKAIKEEMEVLEDNDTWINGLKPPYGCLLYTSPSPRDLSTSRMPSSA